MGAGETSGGNSESEDKNRLGRYYPRYYPGYNNYFYRNPCDQNPDCKKPKKTTKGPPGVRSTRVIRTR